MQPLDEKLRLRLKGLVLGTIDMRHAAATAQLLLDGGPQDLGPRRTLEAGLVVVYARPFSDNGLPKCNVARGLAPELGGIHERLVEQRNTIYAHNDDSHLRSIAEIDGYYAHVDGFSREDLADLLKPGRPLREVWVPPDRAMLQAIVALTNANVRSFSEDIEKLTHRVRGPATPEA